MANQQQRLKAILQKANGFIKNIHSVERILSIIFVLIIFLTLSNLLNSLGADKIGKIVSDKIHHILCVCITLGFLLTIIIKLFKFVKNQYRWLPKIIRNLSYSRLVNVNTTDKSSIRLPDGNTFEWRLATSTSNNHIVAKLETELDPSANTVSRCHYYDTLMDARKDMVGLLFQNENLVASFAVFPLVSTKNYNLELSISKEDISLTKSNIIYVNMIAFNSMYINIITVNALFALLCRHIASLLCTKDKSFADILIYARVSKEQDVFSQIIMAMGFVLDNSVSNKYMQTYVLKFNGKENNIFVQAIFDMIHC